MLHFLFLKLKNTGNSYLLVDVVLISYVLKFLSYLEWNKHYLILKIIYGSLNETALEMSVPFCWLPRDPTETSSPPATLCV